MRLNLEHICLNTGHQLNPLYPCLNRQGFFFSQPKAKQFAFYAHTQKTAFAVFFHACTHYICSFSPRRRQRTCERREPWVLEIRGSGKDYLLVDRTGIEPATSPMPWVRATNCANGPYTWHILHYYLYSCNTIQLFHFFVLNNLTNHTMRRTVQEVELLGRKFMKAIILGSFLFISLNLADDVVVLGGAQLIAPLTPAPVLVRTTLPGVYSAASNLLVPAAIAYWVAKRRKNH
jgi:hypothetical protein